jgi:hypothetical protein
MPEFIKIEQQQNITINAQSQRALLLEALRNAPSHQLYAIGKVLGVYE